MNNDLRVRIAQDVLAQIAAKKLLAERGTYIDVIGLEHRPDDQFNVAFKETSDAKCEVCALGALFIGLINLTNHCTVEQTDGGGFGPFGHLRKRLEDVFGSDQCELIENRFEHWGDFDENEWEKDDEETLIDIMKNIIENNGVFVP